MSFPTADDSSTRNRQRARSRRTTESMEARHQRLSRDRARRRQRLASETPEDREIRLSRRRARDRATRRQRIVSETADVKVLTLPQLACSRSPKMPCIRLLVE